MSYPQPEVATIDRRDLTEYTIGEPDTRTFGTFARELPEPTIELQESSEPISNYYSPLNEVNFLKELRRDHPEIPFNELYPEMMFYYSENMYKFLNEFVGKVPYDEISFLLKGNKLEYARTDIMESMLRTAEMSAVGSRERSDFIGLDKIRDAMNQDAQIDDGRSTVGVKLSPAYFGDYGFAFIFTHDILPDGTKKVTEKIVRYTEKKDTTGESAQIAERMLLSPVPYQTPNDFLENPIIYRSDNPDKDVQDIMEMAHVDPQALAEAEKFKAETRRQLQSWVSQYASKVIEYSFLSPEEIVERGDGELKRMLTMIYNRASDIKLNISGKGQMAPEIERIFNEVEDRGVQEQLLMAYYAQREAMVQGGGSCPAIEGGPGTFYTPSQLTQLVQSGIPYERWMPATSAQEIFGNKCEECGKPNDGHYHCPGKLTIEGDVVACGRTFADETHKPISEWTKRCTCGYEFPCAKYAK